MKFNRQKRNLLALATRISGSAFLSGLSSITALTGLVPAASAASYPNAAFRSTSVDDILVQLFETSDAGEDGSIVIDIPPNPVSDRRIPFRVGSQYAESVALVAHTNRNPLIMFADTSDNPGGIVLGTLDLEQPGLVSCYVMKQGLLSRRTLWVRTPIDAW